MPRLSRQAKAARRRLAKVFISNLKKEIVATEKLKAAVEQFRKDCVEAKTVTSKGIAVPVAISILLGALPEIIYSKKKHLVNHQRWYLK